MHDLDRFLLELLDHGLAKAQETTTRTLVGSQYESGFRGEAERTFRIPAGRDEIRTVLQEWFGAGAAAAAAPAAAAPAPAPPG